MKKFRLLFLLLTTLTIHPFIGFSQDADVRIETGLPSRSSFIARALLNEEGTMILVDISNMDEMAKKANFYLINLETFELVSSFKVKKWTYFHDAFFYKDNSIYLTYGIRIRSKYLIFDGNTGEMTGKVLAKKCPKGEGYYSEELEIDYQKISKDKGKIILEHCVISFDREESVIEISERK